MVPPKQRRRSPSPDPHGMFSGMIVLLVPNGVQARRLQVWKHKLEQMGAKVEDKLSDRVTHIFFSNSNVLLRQVKREDLQRFNGSLVLYQWLENCLKSGEKVPEDPYILKLKFEDEYVGSMHHEHSETRNIDDDSYYSKRMRVSSEDSEVCAPGSMADEDVHKKDQPTIPEHQEELVHDSDVPSDADKEPNLHIQMDSNSNSLEPKSDAPDTSVEKLSSPYNPPDLNRNITEIFGKLINIYRALGDDRRSFSYYKAIPVIEKLSFKIESVDQVKHLPAIGKSLQDHIHEIVTTGKLSKLEHFETDEKVRTVNMFGEVWGIGPATALKLYEKGHRTLDDLKNDDSLTNSQRIGLQFFEDIKKRIPRHEAKDMEMLLQKAGETVLPGVVIICGGSYRRGKASCGDLDIIITHPDGESHKGFLPKYIKYLKAINFLREDLTFSTHSTEGTGSGVDTYFGLCTYPGREERHRIDFKVYPRTIYAFGLVAWTGNDVLNRRLRLLAESKGYRLDDTGLYLATQSSSGKRGMKSSTAISCNTEKEVFDALGFPWLEPQERNL